LNEHDDASSRVGSPEADVVQPAAVAQGDRAGFVDDVVPDPVVGFRVGDLAWDGFGHRVAERCGCGPVRERSAWPPVVVLVDEGVEEGLQLGDRPGLVGPPSKNALAL
jgi:hypothetical protein